MLESPEGFILLAFGLPTLLENPMRRKTRARMELASRHLKLPPPGSTLPLRHPFPTVPMLAQGESCLTNCYNGIWGVQPLLRRDPTSRDTAST